ncbi:radical SAM protein [candidate division CSSED10-310 bacterium]|uniref:Radical SAM protein n=1 Tax=candidate division CSSED10-310 bacterium TaxID=2855610 RepID=A0ABV6YQV5_UNCC1
MAQKYKAYFCPVPFENVYIDYQGNMNPHCAGLVTVSMGNLISHDFMEVWNSDIAQIIRASILTGSFTYCLEQKCQMLLQKKLPRITGMNNPIHKDIIKRRQTTFKVGPTGLNIGYDPTCNLICPSCRTKHYLSTDQVGRSEIIHQKAMGDHLHSAQRLVLSGMGEPFASRLHKEFLQNYHRTLFPLLKIQIVTNGLLLTPEMWFSLSAAHAAIDTLAISIDAATETTYQFNRGGDFKTLLKNLEFIAGLRKKNVINKLIFDFVVQANNYKEMKSFVALGKKYGSDWIAFKHIENWGMYTEKEFEEVAVHKNTHPEHRNLLKILADPVLQHSTIWLRNLAPLLPEDEVADNLLHLDDMEVYNLMLNSMEWDFLSSKLILTPQQSTKIVSILNNLKDEITRIFASSDSGEKLSPLAYISEHSVLLPELNESSLLELCRDNTQDGEMLGNQSFHQVAVDEEVSKAYQNIRKHLSVTQHEKLAHLLRFKPLLQINTGYFPLCEKLNSFFHPGDNKRSSGNI